MKILPLLFVILLIGCNSGSSERSKSAAEPQVQKNVFEHIESERAKNILEENNNTILLDVRTPKEYDSGHLKGAQLLNFNAPEFRKSLQNLNQDKTYIVYCAAGGRSAKASEMMKNMGFSKVYNASEGFMALKRTGIPVE